MAGVTELIRDGARMPGWASSPSFLLLALYCTPLYGAHHDSPKGKRKVELGFTEKQKDSITSRLFTSLVCISWSCALFGKSCSSINDFILKILFSVVSGGCVCKHHRRSCSAPSAVGFNPLVVVRRRNPSA